MAKALLDTAAKQPPKPRAPSLQGASLSDASTLTALLRFQEVIMPPFACYKSQCTAFSDDPAVSWKAARQEGQPGFCCRTC